MDRHVSFFAIGVLIGLVISFIMVSMTLHSQRNDLVKQTCDYAQVASTDTVTELCTKYQEQTNTEYYCNLKKECWVK